MCLGTCFKSPAMQTRFSLAENKTRSLTFLFQRAVKQKNVLFEKCIHTSQNTSCGQYKFVRKCKLWLNPKKFKDGERLLSLPRKCFQNRFELLSFNSSSFILMRYLSTNSYTDALLEDISICIKNNDLALNNLPIWISKLRSSVFDNFSFHLPCKDRLNQKKQIFYNLYCEDLKKRYHDNPHFQVLLNFLEINLNDIDIHLCPILFNTLSLLMPDGHPFLQNLHDLCKENLRLFQLHEIAIFSESIAFCEQNEFETTSEILKLVKNQMSGKFLSDPGCLMAFCEVCRHTGHLMSKETFVKGINFVINSICDNLLTQHPVKALNAFIKFPFGLWGDLENVREKILELELKLDEIRFNLTDLDIDTCLVIGTILDPLLGQYSIIETKRWESFKSFLKEAEIKEPDPVEFLKLCFLFYTTNITPKFMSNLYGNGYQEKNTYLQYQLSSLVDICDNFWLVKILKLCSLGKLPQKISTKIYQKIEKRMSDCSAQHKSWILRENEDELNVLILNFFVEKSSLDVMSSSKPLTMLLMDQKTCLAVGDSVCSKTMAVIALHKIIFDLLNNCVLSKQDMNYGLTLVNRMDIQTLLYLLTVLKSSNKKGRLPNHNKQINHLAETLKKACQEKFSSVSFLPPVSLLPKQPAFYFPLSSHQRMLSSSVVTQLIESLSASTATLDKENCLRATTLLHEASSHNPCYVPQTFENLLQFVYTNEDVPIHSIFSLLKIISLAGYLPVDVEQFKTFCVQFQLNAIQNNLLTPLKQLQLMYHMSLLEMYENIDIYLSLDTLLTLDNEINNLRIFNPASANFHQNCLFHLITNVIVECPQLSVQPFIDAPKYSKEDDPTLERVHQSVLRIFKDSSCVSTSTHSPYGHTIDVLISFDWNGTTFEPKNPDCLAYISNSSRTSHRLAILILRTNHFCSLNNQRLTGATMASIRQLQLLGYTVIEVPSFRLRMMDLQTFDAVDDFLKSKIQSELMIDGLFDIQN